MSKLTIHDKNVGTDALDKFSKLVRGQMVQVNALLMGNTILMGVMVRIGAYGHRYSHYPLTRFLFMGATILLLPIVSSIISITGSQYTAAVESTGSITAVGNCDPNIHTALILVWASFLQILGINTTTIVAADDREEGRSIAPPPVLLMQAVWTTYLGVNIVLGPEPYVPTIEDLFALPILAIFTPFALIFAKIFIKYYARYSSRQSFSFGRNRHLIVGYMLEQLPADDRIISQHGTGQQIIPPPLIVSREDTMVVWKKPHGYRIIYNSSNAGGSIIRSAGDHRSTSKKGFLVIVDKVWELDDTLLKSTTQLKDLCFSFTLFKMLRCRFAKYTSIPEAAAGFTKARDFPWLFLLEDSDGNRTLGLIASELSFLHDYYYSSLPISYSKDWLPISSIFISLLCIGYCLFGTFVLHAYLSYLKVGGKIRCDVISFSSTRTHPAGKVYLECYSDVVSYYFGSMLFDVLPLLLLDALIVLSEVREIASFVCSDWTKLALMCRNISWREYPTPRKWIGLLLRCRCKLVRPWQDNMNRCSIIVLHPRKFRPVALLRHIIPLPEPKKSVKVPREVKFAIFNTLRSSSKGDDLRNGKMSWQQLGIQVGLLSLLHPERRRAPANGREGPRNQSLL